MMSLKKLSMAAALLGTTCLFFGCEKQDSVNVNQDKIYTRYEMDYNANLDVTDVIARFSFGSATGTLLNLTDSTGAYVLFNGDTLHYDDLYMGHHKEYAGKISSGTFTYVNTDGQTFVNTIAAGDTAGFPATLDTISKSSANTVNWVGTPLGANQSVGIFVGSWTWGQDAVFYTDLDGSTGVVMNVANKANLPAGNAMLYMDRAVQKPATQVSSVGGVMVYQYISAKHPVEITN